MKTIIILSLLLTSLNCSAAFRFSSASSPSKEEVDCIDQYHKLIEKNESVDCGHLDENKMREAFYQKKVVHSAACMDLRRIHGDYKSAAILAELEYKEFYCLNKFLAANPKFKAAWTEEMILPESRRDNDWWKTFVLFALLVVGVWFKMRQQKKD